MERYIPPVLSRGKLVKPTNTKNSIAPSISYNLALRSYNNLSRLYDNGLIQPFVKSISKSSYITPILLELLHSATLALQNHHTSFYFGSTRVATSLQITTQSVSRILRQFVEWGWITKTKDAWYDFECPEKSTAAMYRITQDNFQSLVDALEDVWYAPTPQPEVDWDEIFGTDEPEVITSTSKCSLNVLYINYYKLLYIIEYYKNTIYNTVFVTVPAEVVQHFDNILSIGVCMMATQFCCCGPPVLVDTT